MRALFLLALAALALTLPGALQASSTKVWEISDFESFLAGRFEGLSLDDEGRLTLGPRIEEISGLDEAAEAVLWASAAAPNGDIYVGGGHRGRLYRIDAQRRAELFWQAPEIEIFAVAVSPEGQVYAATSPNGKVYRVSGIDKAEEVFDPQAEYIWALLFDKEGTLYVGTGTEGKIYRIASGGEGEIYFDTEQRHVMSLALDARGRLLAGTDPNGILYRIDAKDKAFALYDSDLPEIRDLRVAADGAVWAAAMGGGYSLQDQLTQGVSSLSSIPTTTISVTATASGSATQPAAPQPAASAMQQTPAVSFAPSVVNYGVETAAVVRLNADGEVEKLWKSTEENVLALALEPEGGALFATDRGGRLYRATRSGPAVLVSQTNEQQITSLTRIADALVLTGAHSASAHLLHDAPGKVGTYETGVRDAGAVAEWGRLSWFGAGSVEFQTRSGNSSRPDKTWSEWSPPIRDADGGTVSSPPARFLQWRARFDGDGDRPPVVERVRIAYLPRNRAPEISAVEVAEESADAAAAGSQSQGSSSGAAYSVTVTASPGGSSGSSAAAETAENKLNGGGSNAKLAVKWTADDPDGDDLIAKVEFRGEGESVWKTMKADVDAQKFAVDSQALADGRYRFRVTVSDKRSNPPDSAKEAVKTSLPVIVDHTPPAVVLAETTAVHVRFTASDPSSIVARAEYSVDAGPWTPVVPDDGVADSLDESFTVPLSGLGSGERLITLRVRDRAANAGLAKAVVNIP